MRQTGFVKVKDASRRPVRGLYRRYNKLYARLAIMGKVRRISLKAKDIESAKVEMQGIRASGVEKKIQPVLLKNYYLRYIELIRHLKKPNTVENEREQLKGPITSFFGNKHLHEINPVLIEEFRAKRAKDERSNNTINHNIVVLRNLMKKATAEHLITREMLAKSFEGIVKLKIEQMEKTYLPIDTIQSTATWISENVRCGEIISDAILFLAFCGARWSEGMAVCWTQINWQSEQVCICKTKNSKIRYVDFNPDLKQHLLSVLQRRKPKSLTELIFPTYRVPNDTNPQPLKDIRGALFAAKKKLGHRHWGVHELRHHFTSRCVMAGIDFKTIAEWLGHQDGGLLVAKVYGHLNPEHKRAQAAKLGSSQKNDGKMIHFSAAATVEAVLNNPVNVGDSVKSLAESVANGKS